ncbi:hypothetical protein MCETRH20_01297 [Methylophilaceae bacterium]
MSIKKIANQLNVELINSLEVLNFITSSKKNHFTVSEAKLCEAITEATYTTTGYFNTYVSTYPYVAVHVVGESNRLSEHKDWLKEQISAVLSSHHTIGNVRIM